MKRKIKLRDMTKEQWDTNRDSLCKLPNMYCCSECIFRWVNCAKSSFKRSWINHKEIYNKFFIDQEIEIEEPDILDEQEKEYLRAVIKPFRNRVISISKYFYVFDNAYAIDIYIKSSVGIFETEIIRLPLFKNNMYTGMAKNKAYTLEDLNL